MAILIDKNTPVICQGFTGTQGSFHSRFPIPRALAFIWPVCRYILSSMTTTARPVSSVRMTPWPTLTGWAKPPKESGCALHAYVLMSNPVHWLLTPPQPQDLPRLIISLGRR